MAEPSETEPPAQEEAIGVDAAIYVDASALAKLYVPEAESDILDAFLRARRRLMISELAITEVLSAVARRKREGELHAKQANEIHEAVLGDAASGSFGRLDLSPEVHREAERLLFATDSLPLRTLDIALAFSGGASHILTFDRRMGEVAVQAGLNAIEL
jgi:predicted nucleic acid-binding protein